MLAYFYVIIDDVDPQLRQRLVFAECSTERCKKRSPFFNNYGMSVNIVTNVLRKNIYFLSLDIKVTVSNEEYD